jgi:Cu+-exporting ATPase
VVGVAIAAFVGWWMFGPEPRLAHALVSAVAVLIIACPCALGLATPMAIMVGTGRGAAAGVLARNAEALERFEQVDTLVVDKTGTLTEGRPTLGRVITLGAENEETVLQWTAGLEQASEHPLARAIVEAAHARQLTPASAEGFQALPGLGVSGRVGGQALLFGNTALLSQHGIATGAADARASELQQRGHTVMFLAAGDRLVAMLSVVDAVKPGARAALDALRATGLRIVMLTGDNAITAGAVAADLGIADVRANVRPADKRAVIAALKHEGHKVAMAGDGINDAAALTEATVGIAMGTGSDVAIASAGITLLRGDLRGLVRARTLSRATMRNIRQNLGLAFIYNLVGVPIAAGLFYPWTGQALSPVWASAAMTLSSLSVIGNALRLRRLRLE